MKEMSRKAAWFTVMLLVAGVFGMGCGGSRVAQQIVSPSNIDTGQWQGEIKGQVYGQPFTLPLDVTIQEPLPDENNPVGFFLGAGDPSQVGNLFLESAGRFTVSSGEVTLQYFAVETGGSQLSATLTDAHFAEAAAANQFTAPNVSAQEAPPGPGQNIYETLGPTEMFAFLENARVEMTFDGDTLTGSVQGTGKSISGIFPTGDVAYEADFTATRVG